MGLDLLARNAVEYNHLASFVPDLYADSHPDDDRYAFNSCARCASPTGRMMNGG
jgi:hypothetical protein